MGCASSVVSPDPGARTGTGQDFTSAVPTTTTTTSNNKSSLAPQNKVAPVTSTPIVNKPNNNGLQTPVNSQEGVVNFASGLVFTEAKQRLDPNSDLSDISTIFNIIKRGEFRKFQLLLHEVYQSEERYQEVHYVKGMWDSTPLLVAVQYHQVDIANFLLQRLPPNKERAASAIQTIPFSPPVDVMKSTSAGAKSVTRSSQQFINVALSTIDIDILAHRNEKGASVILYAAMEGMTEIIKPLLQLNLEVDLPPTTEAVYNPVHDMNVICTPLSIAITNNRRDIMMLFLDAGCDTNAIFDFPTIKSTIQSNSKGVKKLRPILLACHYGHVGIVRELLYRNCDISPQIMDEEHCNALHHLAKCKVNPLNKDSKETEEEDGNNVLALREFTSRQIDITTLLRQVNQAGDSPLHIACDQKHVDLVQEFLAEGSHPSLMNVQTGFTPLHIAIRRREADIVQLLVDYGSDPLAKNESNQSVSGKGSGNVQTPYEMSSKLAKDSAIYKIMQQYTESWTKLRNIKMEGSTPASVKVDLKSNKVVELSLNSAKGKVTTTEVSNSFDDILNVSKPIISKKEPADVQVMSIMDIIQQEDSNSPTDEAKQLDQNISEENLQIATKREEIKKQAVDPIAMYMNTIVTPLSKTSTNQERQEAEDDVHDFSMMVDNSQGTPYKDRSKAGRTAAMEHENENEVSFDTLLLDMLTTGKGGDKLDEYLVNHTMDYSNLEEEEEGEKDPNLVMVDVSFDQEVAIGSVKSKGSPSKSQTSPKEKAGNSRSITKSGKQSVVDNANGKSSPTMVTPKKPKQQAGWTGIASSDESPLNQVATNSTVISGAATTTKLVPRPPVAAKQTSFKRKAGPSINKGDSLMDADNNGSTKVTMESKTCEKPSKSSVVTNSMTNSVDQHTSAIATPIRKSVPAATNNVSTKSGKEDGSRGVEIALPSPSNSTKKSGAPSPSNKTASTKGKSPLVRRKVTSAQQ